MAAFAGGEAGRKRLAVGPDSAVLEVFFLPDGHDTLERVNQPTASPKGSGAVRRGDHDGDASLADLETAETVHEGDVADGKLRQRLLRQQIHLLESHFWVGFVIQVECPAAASMVADYTFESYGSTVVRVLDFFQNGLGVDGMIDNRGVTGVWRRFDGGIGVAGAAADWREQSDFVPGFELGIGWGIFLIDGHSQRRGNLAQAGNLLLVVGEEVMQSRMVGQFERVAAAAGNIFEHSEE